MRLEKATLTLTLVTVFLPTGWGKAYSEQTTVLKGSRLPQDQGWLVSANAVIPLDVVTNGSTVTLNTIGVLRKIDQLPGKAFVWFYKEVPFDFNSGFSIEFTLKVHKVEKTAQFIRCRHYVLRFYHRPLWKLRRRTTKSNALPYENALGWGDESERFEMDTTDTFHTYTLTVDDKGVAKIYVDGKRRLKRKKWEGIPRIGFGDMTNDLGVNGRFSIGDIIVTAYHRISPARPAPRHHLIPPSRTAPK